MYFNICIYVYIHVHVHINVHKRTCSDCVAAMHGDVKNTCGMYTPACTSAQDTCLVQRSPQKCTYTCTSTPVQKCSNALDMQPFCPILQLELWPRNRRIPQQPMAQPQLLRHTGSDHLIICLGAGPIQFVHRLHSPMAATEIILHRIVFPPCLRAYRKKRWGGKSPVATKRRDGMLNISSRAISLIFCDFTRMCYSSATLRLLRPSTWPSPRIIVFTDYLMLLLLLRNK